MISVESPILLLAALVPPPVITLAVAVADSGMPPWLAPLAGQGALGCVLAWMLLKTDTRMRRIEEAQDRASKAILLSVIAMQGVPEPVKQQAQDVMREVESAEAARKTK